MSEPCASSAFENVLRDTHARWLQYQFVLPSGPLQWVSSEWLPQRKSPSSMRCLHLHFGQVWNLDGLGSTQ